MNHSVLVVLIGVGLSLGFFYRGATLVMDGAERVREFVLWMSFAVGMLAYSVANVTGSTGVFMRAGPGSEAIGFDDGWHGMVLLLIGGALYVSGEVYVGLQAQKRETAELTREVALLRAEMEQRDDGQINETEEMHDVTGLGANGQEDRDEVAVVPGPGELSVDRSGED